MILIKGRKRNIARDMAIYLARDLTGESAITLGKLLGKISGAGITVRYNHMSKEMERNKRLRGKMNKLKRGIINI